MHLICLYPQPHPDLVSSWLQKWECICLHIPTQMLDYLCSRMQPLMSGSSWHQNDSKQEHIGAPPQFTHRGTQPPSPLALFGDPVSMIALTSENR